MRTKTLSFAWLSATVFFLFAISLSAQDLPVTAPELPETEAPSATMEFERTSYDFGTVETGTTVSQVFTFTNTSDEPLILMDAKGSCGCTVPQWPREPIMPGETASLTVEFNSKNKWGKRNQKVTLTANTNPPQTFLYLTGEVVRGDETDAIDSDISVNEPEVKLSKDCFAIYPNPTAELLKLEVEENNLGQSALISIFSDSGQVMAKREIKVIEGTIEFNVSHYPPGTYIANVKIGAAKPEARCFVVVE